ncbi:hypothetical protein F4778DRAFT_378835 [Xylariomycetidae sp. FL2044]|nr:hypothetical protein F4778DRAFT_378835 [Xylariomycetidae sp. FL2044]
MTSDNGDSDGHTSDGTTESDRTGSGGTTTTTSETEEEEEFYDFPVRQGFADDSWKELSPDRLASFLQSWLFFGLLNALLGESFRVPEFITEMGNTSRNTERGTSKLSLRALSDDKIQAIYSKYSCGNLRVGRLCWFAWNMVLDLDGRGALSDSPAAETGLAILVLVNALELRLRTMHVQTLRITRLPLFKYPWSWWKSQPWWYILLGVCNEDRWNAKVDDTFGDTFTAIENLATRSTWDSWSLESWDSTFLRHWMEDRGWCPQHVAALITEHEPITVLYLAQLRFRNPFGTSHTNCTDAKYIVAYLLLKTAQGRMKSLWVEMMKRC